MKCTEQWQNVAISKQPYTLEGEDTIFLVLKLVSSLQDQAFYDQTAFETVSHCGMQVFNFIEMALLLLAHLKDTVASMTPESLEAKMAVLRCLTLLST